MVPNGELLGWGFQPTESHGIQSWFILSKLRNWPRKFLNKFLDKWLLTGRARPMSSLGTLTGIHTRLYHEAVPLAVLPCESSMVLSAANPQCLLRDSHCARHI